MNYISLKNQQTYNINKKKKNQPHAKLSYVTINMKKYKSISKHLHVHVVCVMTYLLIAQSKIPCTPLHVIKNQNTQEK